MGNAVPAASSGQSELLKVEKSGAVLTVGLNRPAKRNALNDGIILAIHDCFSNLPEGIGAVVIHGIGDHFSSGLDLSELTEHDATEGLIHSQMWHRVFDRIQYSRVPVIAALKGAVIGGGLELACAAHIRVAEPSAYFALPEGQRGIFVRRGGSVRLPGLIGVCRMTGMNAAGNTARAAGAHPLRSISFGDPAVSIERMGDGTIYLRPKTPLGGYPLRLTDRLHHWAEATPHTVFMAEREAGGAWRKLSY